MNLGILGWWHYDNQGDIRILENVTRNLAPHCVVPIDLPFSINEDWIRRFNLLDFVLLGGGGLFQKTPPPPFDTFDLWGSKLESPIGVIGIGIDQIRPQYQGAISALVEKSRFFYVRDAESQRLAGHPKVQVMPDLSFLYPFSRNGEPTAQPQRPPVCGVQLRQVPGLEIDPWARVLLELPVSLRGIPFSTYDIWQEIQILRQLDPACAPAFAPELYENLDLMVGAAFHSILFAIQANVPVVAIAYAPKVERLMRHVGLEHCLLQPEEWERLPATVERILQERDRLIDHLSETSAALTESSRMVMQKVRLEIETSGQRHTQPGPKVSIIVAGCDSETDNQRTLESCLGQTHENTEVILVDASPTAEASSAIPETLVQMVPIEGSESLGERLNRGFARASGQCLTWIAGGNIYTADAIACMLDRLREEPTSDMVYASYYTIHSPGLIADGHQVYSPRKLIRRNVVGPCFLYRRSLAEALGPYRPDSPLADYDYWLRAHTKGSLHPMHTPLLYAVASRMSTADPHVERHVRRQWRSTGPMPLRIFWQIVDTDLVEGLIIHPLLTALRRVGAALRTVRSTFRKWDLGDWQEKGHRILTTTLFGNDRRRWEFVARETPTWDDRNRMIARLIPSGSSVLDLGAGAQTLRQHLNQDCEYQPCDMIASSPDILLCDFNTGQYPRLDKVYDYVVCSGLLEYVRQPLLFLETASSFGHQMLVSYAPRREGDSRLRRSAEGWVNHLNQAELEDLFAEAGLSWSVVGSWHHQLIYRVQRQSPSSIQPDVDHTIEERHHKN